MNTPTLFAERLYFGLPALRLRDATGRVLMRVTGIPPHRATGNLDAIAEDFQLGTHATRDLIEQMIQSGLLERLSPKGMEFGITDKFRGYAQARIVDPLPRDRAQMLVSHIAEMAATTFAMDSVAKLASQMADRGGYDIRLEAAAAKEWNTVRAWEIADRTLQIRGGCSCPIW